ncbi:MAG: hypothetical protein HYR85_23525 [Planctomycetes bacterium]|nr:hypothetical protein [Planctomycetota bacterium]
MTTLRAPVRVIGISLLVLLSLALAPGTGRAQDSSDADRVAHELVALPEEARSDRGAMLDRYLAVLRETQKSPLVELALSRIDEIQDSVRASERLASTYEAILKAGTCTPYTADLVREALRNVYRAQGKTEEARKLLELGGLLSHWEVIGPFGRANTELQDWEFPPEHEIDFAARYAGIGGDVSWRRLDRDAQDPFVQAFTPLYPPEGAAYALCQFLSQTARDAYLVFSPSHSARLWINGAFVLDVDRARFDLPNTYRVPFRMRAGWNRVLVKASTSGEGAFSARLVGIDGAPITDVREESDTTVRPLAAPESQARQAPRAFSTALTMLESAVAKAGDSASPHLFTAYGWALYRNGLETMGLDALRRASEAAPDSPWFLSYYGSALNSAPFLPAGWRTQKARVLYETARAKDPDFVPALLWTASFAAGDDKIEEAATILRHASEVAPTSHVPHLLLAGYFAKQNWRKEQIDELEAARRLEPAQPSVLNALAKFWTDEGNSNRALELWEASLRADQRQDDVRQSLVDAYRERGLDDRVRDLYGKSREQDPRVDLSRSESIAAFERDRGDTNRAIAAYLDLAKRYPRYSSFKKEIGDLFLELGDADTARSWYHRALDVDPGYHQVREILRRLEGGEDPEFKAYEVDALKLLREAPDASRYPRATSLAVLDDLVLRLYEDGSNRRITHQLFKIQNEHGVEKYATFRPGEELLELHVIKPDGSVLEPVTLPAEQGLTLPGLGIGAAVEWRYADMDRWPPGMPLDIPAFYFQDVDQEEPFLWSRYVVIQPKSLDVRHIVQNFPGEPEVHDLPDGQTRVTIYQVHNQSIVKKEPYMPDPREVVPRVTLSQNRTWKEVNQAYKRLAALRLTPELERAARATTAGVDGDYAKAKKLYEFVNETVRESSNSNNPTAALLERKGNRLSLYRALLRAAGVPFDEARCRVNPGLDAEDPQWDWVRESLYPQAIVRVMPRDHEPVWVWLEVRDLPFGRIPFYLSEAPVFVIDGGEGRRETMPKLPSDEFLTSDTSANIDVEEGGAFAVGMQTRIPAFAGYGLKETFRTLEDQQRKQLGARMMMQYFPGSTLRTIEFPGLAQPDSPMAIDVTAGLRRFVDTSGGEIGCKTGIAPLHLTARFSSGDKRTWPVVYRDFEHQRNHVTIHLGNKYRVKRLPKSLESRGFFGNYRFDCREENGAIVVEREVAFDPERISIERYPELIAWCREIDDREDERIVLESTE